ncbi:TPA: methyltransferase domain-containing protein [Candidatus Poribacteria bacterium]|nr:methyltransferase domain-containing protein [Candidatus Poribacteria bacterium]
MNKPDLIIPKYDVKTDKYSLGTEWITITMVDDTNRLLDEMSTKDHLLETNFPFWAELWPSGLALARYIWSNFDFHGEQVLELGCGLGIVGIVARKKQAKVLMTDYNNDALIFAKYNAIKNRCEDIQFLRMDWRHPNLDNQKFKYILAADIIYEEQNWIPIVNIFDTYLEAHGEAILAEPNRPNAKGFFEILRRKGFSFSQISNTVSLNGGVSRVLIYRIRYKSG